MAAIALLARRDFASGELRQKLGSQGYDPAVAAAVVAELTEARALDDARYAENYVAYHSGRGHGPVRIGADLRSLGVPADLVQAALGNDEPGACDAGLPAVEERGEFETGGRLVEVGVVEDESGRLAAELEAAPP